MSMTRPTVRRRGPDTSASTRWAFGDVR
jgi:hypothetical protein